MPLYNPPSSGSGAPTTADYLVGTADAGLSAEIAVGTTPGGELGGTWAAPTVDATHSGSTHSASTDTHIADTTPHDIVYVATPADFAINSVTDITIATNNVANVVAGNQIIVDAWFVILNNSTATRVYQISLDFDGVYPAEFTSGALATSSTLLHPMHLSAVLDVRATNLTYAMAEIDGIPAAGIADDAVMTMGTTGLHARTWGTQTTDVTGTVTVSLFIRSANATATQTCRLSHFSIRKVAP